MARALRLRGFLSALLIVIYINGAITQYLGPWMPIPNEVILKRLNINAPRFIQRFHTASTVNTDVTTIKAEDGKNNAIKLVAPQEFLGEFSVPTFKAKISEKRANLQTATEKFEHEDKNIICKEDKNTTEIENNGSEIATSTLANTRKAKKIEIVGNIFPNETGNSGQNQEEKYKKLVTNQKILTTLQDPEKSESSNSYEVTEKSDLIDYSNTAATIFKEPSGYIYSKPNNNNDKQKDFSQNLFEILDKYNIHPQDKLSNYDQSLKPKTEAMNTKTIFLPIPLEFHRRYNSLNHSPIDPLLAVFLSNYGYYLPNSYGPLNGYRNLYGYLASNNIHNNKPFGLYKIFSDTDSSSK